MNESELKRALHPYLRKETLKVALSGYLGAGFRRAVLGVTDRRVLLVKRPLVGPRQGLLADDRRGGAGRQPHGVPRERRLHRQYVRPHTSRGSSKFVGTPVRTSSAGADARRSVEIC